MLSNLREKGRSCTIVVQSEHERPFTKTFFEHIVLGCVKLELKKINMEPNHRHEGRTRFKTNTSQMYCEELGVKF